MREEAQEIADKLGFDLKNFHMVINLELES